MEETKPACDIFGQVLSPLHDPYIVRNFKTKARRSPATYATVARLGEQAGLFKARDKYDLPHCLDAAMRAAGAMQSVTIEPFAATDFTDNLRKFIQNTQK